MDRSARETLVKEALSHVLSINTERGYDDWRRLVGDAMVLPHPGNPQIEIEVCPVWDQGPGGPIRVVVSVLHTTPFGIVVPGTDFFVHPDGRVEA
jgi:hypothetical protein